MQYEPKLPYPISHWMQRTFLLASCVLEVWCTFTDILDKQYLTAFFHVFSSSLFTFIESFYTLVSVVTSLNKLQYKYMALNPTSDDLQLFVCSRPRRIELGSTVPWSEAQWWASEDDRLVWIYSNSCSRICHINFSTGIPFSGADSDWKCYAACCVEGTSVHGRLVHYGSVWTSISYFSFQVSHPLDIVYITFDFNSSSSW